MTLFGWARIDFGVLCPRSSSILAASCAGSEPVQFSALTGMRCSFTSGIQFFTVHSRGSRALASPAIWQPHAGQSAAGVFPRGRTRYCS